MSAADCAPLSAGAKIVATPAFHAADGTELAYRVEGEGIPLVCLPGGPMRDSIYLGDLGGLSARRQLIALDLRGTGQSAIPEDAASYRCDRLADDVEALREHLGLDRFDLLGHSAGANITVQYAARHPQRVSRLALITPSTRAVGLEASSDMRREIIRLRQGEPWFAEAAAAFERIQANGGTNDDWEAIAPSLYSRWDTTARADHTANDKQINEEAARAFGADGAFDPAATRAALAAFSSPVLLLAAELDPNTPPRLAAEFAALFPNARLVIQPGSSHASPGSMTPAGSSRPRRRSWKSSNQARPSRRFTDGIPLASVHAP
jgi:pimeloyl-ACP methyl ester carboxylesterase